MNKPVKQIGAFIIGSAIIWAAVIVGCSLALRRTGCYNEIQNILAGGVIAHLILIWGPLIAIFKKGKTNETDDNVKD